MAHAQQQILDTLQALLIAGATVAGARVFVDRVDPLQASELPAILIEESDGGESVELFQLSGDQKRTLDVTISCVLDHTSAAPALARDFGLAVEKAIVADPALRSLCSLGLGLSNSRLVVNGEADRLIASRQQSWSFSYLVSYLSPDLIL